MLNKCLYCGEEMHRHYDEYTPYYECDCADAKLKREIQEKIQELISRIPSNKFQLIKQTVLRRIKE